MSIAHMLSLQEQTSMTYTRIEIVSWIAGLTKKNYIFLDMLKFSKTQIIKLFVKEIETCFGVSMNILLCANGIFKIK